MSHSTSSNACRARLRVDDQPCAPADDADESRPDRTRHAVAGSALCAICQRSPPSHRHVVGRPLQIGVWWRRTTISYVAIGISNSIRCAHTWSPHPTTMNGRASIAMQTFAAIRWCARIRPTWHSASTGRISPLRTVVLSLIRRAIRTMTKFDCICSVSMRSARRIFRRSSRPSSVGAPGLRRLGGR
jgi:hypothetical protein